MSLTFEWGVSSFCNNFSFLLGHLLSPGRSHLVFPILIRSRVDILAFYGENMKVIVIWWTTYLSFSRISSLSRNSRPQSQIYLCDWILRVATSWTFSWLLLLWDSILWNDTLQIINCLLVLALAGTEALDQHNQHQDCSQSKSAKGRNQLETFIVAESTARAF